MDEERYYSIINIPGCICKLCGCIVKDPKVHDEWHDKFHEIVNLVDKKIGMR